MESEDTENEVIEIVPMDEYQFNRAKLKSSLAWILQKAFGENVPNEFKEPFYEKSDGNFQVKPHLINSLVSSDVYCQACARMFSETSQQWQGHCSIIQVLSRKGIYVMEKDESAVTETILMQTAPFRVNAHIALIDALMLAYASEVVSVEHAVQAVRRITTFNASSELPSGTEDSVIFWLNKVCTTAIEKEKKSEQTGTSSPSDSVTVPVMTDILKDIGDGCTVAVVCSFYCPQSLNFHDICLKDGLGIANSLYNLRLIKTFCERHLPINFFHFTYEDLLYTRDSIRENLLAFLAELFFWFEMIKLTETGQLLNGQETETSHYGNGRSSVTKHQVPISNATKRSFHKTESRFTSTPELNKSNSTSHIPQNRQVLLPKRQNGTHTDSKTDGDVSQKTETAQYTRRANSVSSPQERNVIKESVLAWQEQEHLQRRDSAPTNQNQTGESSTLLANVSIDSELCQSFADEQLNFGDLDTPRTPQPTMSNYNDSDSMKLESVTPGDQSRQSNVSDQEQKLEPLMPAVLKPAKEKHLNHSKADERDETPRKRTTSPTKPRKPPRTSPTTADGFPSQGDITVEATVSLNLDTTQTCLSDELVSVSPLSDTQQTPRITETNVGQGEGEGQMPNRGYEAFYINPDVSVEVSLPSLPLAADSEVASSYTIVDQVHTIESARAAGIPVVTKSEETSPLRRATSRDDSMTSSRSSGDFSDHESHKIHYDHKARETASSAKISPRAIHPPPPQQPPPTTEVTKPALVVVAETPKILDPSSDKTKSMTTNFAEIKRLKDAYGNVDGSAMVYMQHGQEQQGNGRAPLKSAFLRKQADAGKKTSFAMLPNETTWQMTAMAVRDGGKDNSQEGEQQVTSELAALRMKLDEKRKEIERRKQRLELQQNKMRQRLGKAAFMRVMSRHIDDSKDRASPLLDSDDRVGPMRHEMQRPRSLSPTSTSHKSRPFSREGIQETIDNVRRRWFRDDDLLGGTSRAAEISDEKPAVEPVCVSKDPAAVKSQADAVPAEVVHRPAGSPYPQAMTDSAESLPSSENEAPFEAYDSSLDKLNQSLTELQGEISRLSLQQEQILSMQSPQGTPPCLHPLSKQQPPLAGHPVPHQIALPPGGHVGQGEPSDPAAALAPQQIQQFPPKGPASVISRHTPPVAQTLPYISPAQTMGQTYVSAPATQQHPQFAETHTASSTTPLPQDVSHSDTYKLTSAAVSGAAGDQQQQQPAEVQRDASSENGDDGASSHTSSGGNEGFFVSFGDESSTPKRSKPVLSKDRVKKNSSVNNHTVSTPSDGQSTAVHGSSPMDVQGTPTITVYKSAKAGGSESHNSSGIGYVLDESDLGFNRTSEQEMMSKKDRLVERQMKRKEEQERRRLEKEMELMEQRERERLKQEDAEQKKAEEKARRKQIYEQYLQKKRQKESMENGGERPIEPNRASDRTAKSKPRPKSMFVKATPSDQEDTSSVGSQDDTSIRGFGMKSRPYGSSHPSHFRIGTPRGNMRKAVSCNVLTQNGQTGGATYRRPPSPDLYRLGRRTPRMDGSETGEYSGPKLYVKPSSKSNRHIILNAISHCCLAGIVNTDLKNKVLEELAKADAKHFVILFRDGGCQYRALYSFTPETDEVIKICGVGPKEITNKMIHRFYKYNSGAKSFTEVTSTKHLSVSIDAVVIHNALWKTGKPPATSKKVY